MSSAQPIRIGIVGAGGNVRLRHIPGFRAIEGVELVSVSNRTRESSRRTSAEFDIPVAYDNWLDLVEADDTDAICIGTWPYMHCPITLAALSSGKHVLTEARMAMDAEEARAMLRASRESPHLVAQVVPSPFTLKVDRTIQDLVSEGYLGDILAVELDAAQPTFLDADVPLHWRHDASLSGFNTLTLGIWYEALARWVGPATRVMAMARTFANRRRDGQGVVRAVTVPDHVEVLCDMACGAQAHLRFSAVTGLAPGGQAYLHGSHGTLRLDLASMRLFGGKRGSQALEELEVPPARQGRWRVEEEFVGAIRGLEPVALTTFEAGVQYMEFTEAVAISARTGEAVHLPL